MFDRLRSALWEVWRISWPLVIANSFWNLQVTIDRMFLGQYSTESLGAAIATVGFFWAPMALVQQTSAYVTTFIAQYQGAQRYQDIGPSFWQSIYLSLVGGVLFLILVPLAPWIFSLMGHAESLQVLEVQYFQALAYSALPTALVAACSGYFTGLGYSRTIMIINGAGLLLNVLFDYLFIFGHAGFPSMGIAGAGWATTVSNYGASGVGIFLVLRAGVRSEHNLKQWRPQWERLKRLLRFGVPSGMQWALEGLAFTFFLALLGRLPNGEAALSASGITVTVMMLAILPVLGVAQGVSTLVGQALGENHSEKATIVSWAGALLSSCYIVVIGLSFVLLPDFYMNLFGGGAETPLWGEVSQIVPILLIFVALFIFFDSLNLIFSFALKGAGDTAFVSAVALLLPWPLMVLPTWYVSDWEEGVYWAWAAASLFICIQGLVFLWRFLQGRWLQLRVI